jgi:glyoxylase-like metal-dependent hydrolase (beta-lactamase superfamily II)
MTRIDFIFEQIRTGGDRNFGYLVGDRAAGVGALIDPSYDPEMLLERATDQGLEVEVIINTHGHPDHTNGNRRVRELSQARLAAHPSAASSPDIELEHGSSLGLGSLTLRFLHVPGHSEDHLLVHLAEQRVAITGDLLFVGKIGGTGTEEAARREYESLKRVLEELPDDTTIWPGHDYGCRPSSTIALEKIMNPFLQCEGFGDFFQLKKDWPTFKERHGLK